MKTKDQKYLVKSMQLKAYWHRGPRQRNGTIGIPDWVYGGPNCGSRFSKEEAELIVDSAFIFERAVKVKWG